MGGGVGLGGEGVGLEGGGRRVRGEGQGGCEWRSEAFVEFQKKKKIGGGGRGEGGRVWRRFLKDFFHIWAWRPYWSCDPDAANKLSFPLPKEAPHKIWL